MNKQAAGFSVIHPGILTLIQDMGRFGFHGIGLTNGGPMDSLAFSWANRLCSNPVNTTALEVSVGGLVLEANASATIAVTGADMPLTINGQEKELWRTYCVKPGDKIELGFAQNACRSYLAVTGGFLIAPSFSSTATVTRESIGGLRGDRLQEGDYLPCTDEAVAEQWLLAESDRPCYSKNVSLHVIPGYQQHAFDDFQQVRFFSSEYSVSDRCDRMGYRLEGAAIQASIDGILSEGICHGAIQIPADGQPIVLLNDRQTIGGYPKIGSVISVDTAKLAQLMPGAKVSFNRASMEYAHNSLHFQQSRFESTELVKVG